MRNALTILLNCVQGKIFHAARLSGNYLRAWIHTRKLLYGTIQHLKLVKKLQINDENKEEGFAA